MANLPWLDEVLSRLAKRGLPPSYIKRFVGELADHLEDFTEDNMSTDADVRSRLGEPEHVVNAAVTAYRRRSFLGRHPTAAFLVFAISPVVPQLILGYVACLPLAVAFHILVRVGAFRVVGLQPSAELAWFLVLSFLIAPCSAAASLLYGELAMHFQLAKKWLVASCVVLGVMAIWWEYAINYTMFSDVHNGSLLAIVFPVQFFVPFAAAWWFTHRQCDARYPITAFFIFAVSPIVLLVALCVVSYFLLFIVSLLFPFSRFDDEHFTRMALLALASLFNLLMVVIPSIIASLLYCKLARHFGIGTRWAIVSCTIVAAGGALYCFSVSSTDSWGHYYLHDGIGFWSPMQFVQFVIPLAVGWWFLRRNSDKVQLQTAS